MAARGYRTISVQLKTEVVPVRASPRVADALEEISGNMDVYQGVRLHQLLEAAYTQGKKDGAREAFEEIDASVEAVKRAIPHRSVGRPRTRRRS